MIRVAFAGTPEFAAVALRAVAAAGFHIPLVLTQPDRPAGRGLKLQASPVKQWALTHDVTVAQPRSLRLDGLTPEDAGAARDALLAAAPDVLVVAAYGLILPSWVLDLPPLGCLNIHGSLLPRWRGAAPIQRAVEAGDSQTGITIMQMDAGLDTGAMLLAGVEPIHADDSSATLHDRLALLGGRLVVQVLHDAAARRLQPQAQPDTGVSYAHKIAKTEAAIDWQLPAARLASRVRAFDPFPGATFGIDGETVKLWRAQAVAAQSGAPGTVLPTAPGRCVVACGTGALDLLELQRTGGRRVSAAQFQQGRPLAPGTILR
jgi:methionyl-tRNA formyltransferase